MSILIISDIAGQYKALMQLIAKCPKADLILSVGDLVDRGPDSKRVIEWFMKKPDQREALLGNHDQMMVNACLSEEGVGNGSLGLWLDNGGGATLQSYASLTDPKVMDVNPKHIEWLQKRPLYYETEDLFVSHAPLTSLKNKPLDRFSRAHQDVGMYDYSFIWSRGMPHKPQPKFMIHGHNWLFREYKGGDGKVFGLCIDSSSTNELVGLYWKNKNDYQIFKQKYEEKEVL